MRRCECSVRSPSKRTNRCLPWASTLRTPRPWSRSGQRSAAWRGCGVSIETISLPTSAARSRLAAWWMVSPSGTRPRLGAESEPARALAEAELDQLLADRRADDRLAVEALDAQARHAPAADLGGQRLDRLAQVALTGIAERQQAAAAALHVEHRLGIARDHEGTRHAGRSPPCGKWPARPATQLFALRVVLFALRPGQRGAVGVRRVGGRQHERPGGLVGAQRAQPLHRGRQRELRAAEAFHEVAAPRGAERLEVGQLAI